MEEKSGKLILVSAPSGGGKNAIIRALLKRFPNSTQLVTTTTRNMRPGEVNGKDYHFLDKKIFKKKIATGGFIEYNEYDGNLYGTQWGDLNDALDKYNLVFSQAEVNGKRHLDEQNVKHISIFLEPESFEILKGRIQKRGGTSDDSIAIRLKTAKHEIDASDSYDFCVVNKDGEMNQTVNKIVGYLVQKKGIKTY